MKNIFTLLLITSFLQGYTQNCDTSLISIKKIRASDTDPNISWELYKHYSFYNPDCTSKNKLIIYLVGTYGEPYMNQLFPVLAANNGFHVISIKYPNNLSAVQACSTDPNSGCYTNFRTEVLYGTDLSSAINIDTTNSILNRATKLLIYLKQNYSNENWSQYLDTNNNIIWSNTITAGHSQGGGHAAFIAHEFDVSRVLMFASPNDYRDSIYNTPAPWLSDVFPTPDSVFYAFGNTNDEIVGYYKQFAAWNNLGLLNYGDSVNVYNICPYNNSHTLYTSQLFTGGISVNHGSVIADDNTPVDSNGSPVFSSVWKYMLGICSTTSSIFEPNILLAKSIYPNPVKDKLYFDINNIEQSKILIIIYDAQGHEIIKTDQPLVDMRNYHEGMYLYRIMNLKTRQLTFGKFIKSK